MERKTTKTKRRSLISKWLGESQDQCCQSELAASARRPPRIERIARHNLLAGKKCWKRTSAAGGEEITAVVSEQTGEITRQQTVGRKLAIERPRRDVS